MQRSAERFVWGTAFVALVVAAAAVLMAWRDDKPREIRLVARDMTFYVEGSDEANPTLTLRAGEQVRVTLRNEDQGMTHDFAVRAWDVATPPLEGKGKEASIVFRVPESPGPQEYTCTPHSATMRGAIDIGGRAQGS